ncbi:MAG TPA: 23S rRNA (pseudouridine(1915)-N(3))-methyltransferase RlmH [Longimicrobiaceae bacterium]|nr:23S rRNA (pseudouridine(1915)-N(3))-methyltransferase RlmH [Longimicrobiaceae bacterium]
MKVALLCVGKPRGPVADAIEAYEARIGRYFSFEAIEVKETAHRSQPVPRVVEEEGERILARVPQHHELVALHRPGKAWSSEALASHLADAGLRGTAGVAFVIGGAYGLSSPLLERADHLMSLSSMTLPHELARLVLSEQLYRAGTIVRGEPYHKGPVAG